MTGFTVWALWVTGFGLLAGGLLQRLIVARRTAPRLQLAGTAVYCAIAALGAGLGVYQLLTTAPARLQEPIGAGLLVVTVLAFGILVGIVIREAYLWDGWYLVRRGDALMAAKQYARALQVYDRLLKRRRYRAAALARKAWALYALGQPEEALACAQEAIRLAPREASLWSVEGFALLFLQRETEGMDTLRHAVELAPQDGQWWARYAYALEYTGQTTQARETAERAFELLGPRGPVDVRASALATVSLALSAEDLPTDALARADDALALFAQSPRAYLARATALQRLGRQEDAQVAVEQGLTLVQQQLASAPKSGELVAVQARLVQLLGQEQGLRTRASAAESAGDASHITPNEDL